MFYTDRTCYPLVGSSLDHSAEHVVLCGERGPTIYLKQQR
jgi:hypothetical protein